MYAVLFQATTLNGDTMTVKNQRFEMKSKDFNLNDNFEDVDTVDTAVEPIANKLPNVGGSLLSQRPVKRETNNNVRNGVVPKKQTETPPRTNGDLGPKEKFLNSRTTKTPPLQAIKLVSKPTKAPAASTKPRSVAASPSQPKTPVQQTVTYPTTPTPTKPAVTPVEKSKVYYNSSLLNI